MKIKYDLPWHFNSLALRFLCDSSRIADTGTTNTKTIAVATTTTTTTTAAAAATATTTTTTTAAAAVSIIATTGQRIRVLESTPFTQHSKYLFSPEEHAPSFTYRVTYRVTDTDASADRFTRNKKGFGLYTRSA